jgi:hypothetical protein
VHTNYVAIALTEVPFSLISLYLNGVFFFFFLKKKRFDSRSSIVI